MCKADPSSRSMKTRRTGRGAEVVAATDVETSTASHNFRHGVYVSRVADCG